MSMNETKRGYKHLFEQLESLLCPVALLEKKQNKNKKNLLVLAPNPPTI